MSETRGDALEWAIALSKAPGERIALRQRPIPSQMETLLQIAAGVSADAVADARMRTGESENDLLEAARFYIREILFFQGADAYRTLGLPANADAELLRTHYRLLQQWLHPDRQTSDWDAIFASRVNVAWSELRTPARRADYDAKRLLQARQPRSNRPTWAPVMRASTGNVPLLDDAAAWHRDRWRRRVPVVALGSVCVVLAIAVMRDIQRAPQDGVGEKPNAGASGAYPQTPVQLQIPRQPALFGFRRDVPREQNPSKVVQVSKPSQRKVVPLPAASVRSPALPAPIAVASSTSSTPMRTTLAAGSRVPTLKTKSVPIPEPSAIAKPTKATGISTATKPVLIAEVAPREVPPTRVAFTRVAPQVAVSVKEKRFVRTAAPSPPTPPVAAIPDVKSKSGVVPSKASPQQVGQAERIANQLQTFVTSRSNIVPSIWASPAVLAKAVEMRSALQDVGPVKGGAMHWRIGATSAAMSSEMKAGSEQRNMQVVLVWRNERWLVSSLSLDGS